MIQPMRVHSVHFWLTIRYHDFVSLSADSFLSLVSMTLGYALFIAFATTRDGEKIKYVKTGGDGAFQEGRCDKLSLSSPYLQATSVLFCINPYLFRSRQL